jgi:hypothetical protein
VRRANGLDFNESLIAGAGVPRMPGLRQCLTGFAISGDYREQTQGARRQKPAVHIDKGCFKFEQQPELDAYYPLKAQLHAARVHS